MHHREEGTTAKHLIKASTDRKFRRRLVRVMVDHRCHAYGALEGLRGSGKIVRTGFGGEI